MRYYGTLLKLKGGEFMDDHNVTPHANQNEEKTYVCLGTCNGMVTEEQFKNGQDTCSTKGCTLEGHPLVPGRKNPETGKNEATEE